MQTININTIGHIYPNLNDLEQDAASRETSQEIMVAIAERAETAEQVEIIWSEGTDEQTVIARAWELADEDEDELNWGENTITR